MTKNKTIPPGSYCYRMVPAPGSGFANEAALHAHLASLPLEEQLVLLMTQTRMIHCPYWRSIGKGRVHCKLLKRTAVLIGTRSEHLALAFYKRHPKAKERDKGFLLGDAVKECSINP